jgi:hypothetical protein
VLPSTSRLSHIPYSSETSSHFFNKRESSIHYVASPPQSFRA